MQPAPYGCEITLFFLGLQIYGRPTAYIPNYIFLISHRLLPLAAHHIIRWTKTRKVTNVYEKDIGLIDLLM